MRAGYRVLLRSAFDLAREFLEAEAPQQKRPLVSRLTKIDLLVIEDFGMKRLGPNAAEDLLEVLVRRHERASTVVTTNRPTQGLGRLPRRHPRRDCHPRPLSLTPRSSGCRARATACTYARCAAVLSRTSDRDARGAVEADASTGTRQRPRFPAAAWKTLRVSHNSHRPLPIRSKPARRLEHAPALGHTPRPSPEVAALQPFPRPVACAVRLRIRDKVVGEAESKRTSRREPVRVAWALRRSSTSSVSRRSPRQPSASSD